MSLQQTLDEIRALDGVVELAPAAGSDFPEIAWGDHFFYYAPDGQIPQRGQPFVTVVTKDYPGDAECDLDPPGRWRLNIHAGKDAVGEVPTDLTLADVVVPHPVYARQGWVAVVTPGERSAATVRALLRDAHQRARARWR